MRKSLFLACTAVSTVLLSTHSIQAAEAKQVDTKQLMELLDKQQKQLEEQKNEMNRLSKKVRDLDGKKLKPKPYKRQLINTGNKAKIEKRPDQVVGVDRKPEERTEPPQVAAIQNNGVLLQKGRAVFEPSLEYSRSSSLNVAIEGFTIVPALNIGSFAITAVDRDTLVASMAGRLGVAKDTEIEVRIPYLYRNDSTLGRNIGAGATVDTLSSVDGNNLGDVEFAVRRQFTHGENGWPFLIGGLRFKSITGKDPFEVPINSAGLQSELPTGSGFYALQPTLSAILPSDPVVLYGSIGYLYNMERDVGGTFGEIDPGDSISMGFGMGFSVNEKTSFSLGYSHSYVMETKQNGTRIANSDDLHVGTFSTGFAYRVSDKTNFNMNVETGLTEDAPDVRLIFRVPMSFDLF